MAKKKHGKPGKRRHADKPKIEAPLPTFDRRSMEQVMAALQKQLASGEFQGGVMDVRELLAGGSGTADTARSPIERAQDLIYQAWETPSASGRSRLAREALAISPDCADAYLLLAEESAGSIEEAREFYEQAVLAGERALGPEAFREYAGHFWGFLETRPYMRAREALATCLWQLGERQKAIEHYRDMLRLNPNDNQGIRYLLATALLEERDDEALGELLDQYDEEASAAWLYTRALWLFRREGASAAANKALKNGISQNRHVPAYLLQKKQMPRELPAYIGFGDENEAISYTHNAIKAWHETPGAREWLAQHTAEGRR